MGLIASKYYVIDPEISCTKWLKRRKIEVTCPPRRLLEETFGRGLQCLPLQQNNFFLTHWLFIARQCNIILASCSLNSLSKMVGVLSLHCCRNLAFILTSKPIFSAQINAYASLLWFVRSDSSAWNLRGVYLFKMIFFFLIFTVKIGLSSLWNQYKNYKVLSSM